MINLLKRTELFRAITPSEIDMNFIDIERTVNEISNLLSSVNSVEIINDLATGGTTKALSAEQGKVLYFSKLASSGSNYLYVSGIGNPTENAIELQAAYDEAKKMPRFLGFLNPSNTVYIYAGQTFGRYIEDILKCYKVLVDGTYNPLQMPESLIVTEAEAKSTRTKVVVAPGEYDFGATTFVADTSGIDIASLTGNSDVIISSTEVNSSSMFTYGIKVTADNILIKGINCKTNTFYIADNLDNLICEYCIGGGNSFGGHFAAPSGIFNYCIAGMYSFGGYGSTVSGTFNNCVAGNYSFGGSYTSGIFNHCIGGEGSFGSSSGGNTSGTFNYCIGGGNSFGGGCNASGTFNNCTGGSSSFGAAGNTSGTFNHCIGGENSFGSYGTISATARLYYTRLTSGTFPTPVTGGRLILCIDGGNNIITV